MHWLLKTKAGIALGYAAALGLLVGAVVTSQTLYAATAASLREFAVLCALGIPRWRMSRLVLTQAFFVGLIGILLSLPAMFGAAKLADWFTVQVHLYWWLLTSAAAITLVMAYGVRVGCRAFPTTRRTGDIITMIHQGSTIFRQQELRAMLDDSLDPPLIGRNLRREFGEGETRAVALDGVSVEIGSGQMALLMGPSGSGKSTLLAILSGLLSPTSGEVLALGQKLWSMSEVEREQFRLRYCGFIFQGYNLFRCSDRQTAARNDCRVGRVWFSA
jgi:ABC-type multidrug transport system fused ATPase/permease subunit